MSMYLGVLHFNMLLNIYQSEWKFNWVVMDSCIKYCKYILVWLAFKLLQIFLNQATLFEKTGIIQISEYVIVWVSLLMN
jgi:hypothetical protein